LRQNLRLNFQCNEYTTVHCFRRRRMEWTEYTRCNRLRRNCVIACTVYFSLNKSTGCTHNYGDSRTPLLIALHVLRLIGISRYCRLSESADEYKRIFSHHTNDVYWSIGCRSNRLDSRKTICCDLITKSQYSEPYNHINIIRGRF